MSQCPHTYVVRTCELTPDPRDRGSKRYAQNKRLLQALFKAKIWTIPCCLSRHQMQLNNLISAISTNKALKFSNMYTAIVLLASVLGGTSRSNCFFCLFCCLSIRNHLLLLELSLKSKQHNTDTAQRFMKPACMLHVTSYLASKTICIIWDSSHSKF